MSQPKLPSTLERLPAVGQTVFDHLPDDVRRDHELVNEGDSAIVAAALMTNVELLAEVREFARHDNPRRLGTPTHGSLSPPLSGWGPIGGSCASQIHCTEFRGIT